MQARQDIDLLFTDVVMPETSGHQLAQAAKALHPQLKVLYTSGYTRDEVMQDGALDQGIHLLAKPYSIDEMAKRVRLVIEEPAASAHAG